LLKALEPGTGYSRLKQWAIEHNLVFENFTKDSLIISGAFRDTDDKAQYSIRIAAKFCAGDDYAGRAFSITWQQWVERNTAPFEVFEKERRYIDLLAGKSSDQGQYKGDYRLRREARKDVVGLAVGQDSKEGNWDVGLFAGDPFLMLQVTRKKDEICK
jgi:hypothetical protein